MTVWLDAQLSPRLAPWIEETLAIPTKAVRDLGLRDADDFEIFQAAREANVIVLTKDADFPHLLSQHGTPPQVIWLTCGNTTNLNLQRILSTTLHPALEMLASGESIIEIKG
ncbi:hypothetical protein PDESU_05093 [Pontiella desulfatans]|uniref:DUF5615 domain-containing protein n=1 Tax=Pontiella desulfatans TaxID=2750659 RepID=A0A6C2U8R1_PONDE|nr:DUF5615 family PIN-like protein [Pontiella desulfatans]VGO16502.1 hypothetical protein PDESU_05093 [Pontiella desulfatans]